MTIEGAIAELKNLIDVDDVPFYYKGGIQKVIETIEQMPPSNNWECYSDRLWKNAYERGKAEAEPKWIPCEERLPESWDTVVVTNRKQEVEVLRLSHTKVWCDLDDDYYADFDYVIAWMPLPDPYEGGR